MDWPAEAAVLAIKKKKKGKREGKREGERGERDGREEVVGGR